MNTYLFIIIAASMLISCKDVKSKHSSDLHHKSDTVRHSLRGHETDSAKLETIKLLNSKASEYHLRVFSLDLDDSKGYLLDSLQYYHEKTLEIDSTNFVALTGLRDVYVMRKNAQKAVYYAKKIFINTPKGEYYANLEIYNIYENLYMKKEALISLQKGIKLISDHLKNSSVEDPELLSLLQLYIARNGKIDVAYAELEKLDKKFPNNKHILNTLKILKFVKFK